TQFELPMPVIQALIKRIHSFEGKLILNPAPYRPITPEFLALVDFFVPNETEAEKFSGVHVADMDSAQQACRVLLDMGIQNVIMTLGAKGALLANPHGIQHIPGVKVNPVDTTAAGDTFIGAFAAAMVRKFSLKDAVRYANCAGAIAVTRFGAQTSIPAAEEVDALYARQ
ncbi:MAG TPA: PfkB family carbohydrate kinase, partial [Anaerolineaceae bacterium]|nr:PfkB family carbohydrate kinase [Anaerolineaceae bacterium]